MRRYGWTRAGELLHLDMKKLRLTDRSRWPKRALVLSRPIGLQAADDARGKILGLSAQQYLRGVMHVAGGDAPQIQPRQRRRHTGRAAHAGQNQVGVEFDPPARAKPRLWPFLQLRHPEAVVTTHALPSASVDVNALEAFDALVAGLSLTSTQAQASPRALASWDATTAR